MRSAWGWATILALLIGSPCPAGPDDPGPRLVRVAPGTVVAGSPPAGWTHFVLKATPRLAAGDLDSLPAVAARTATLFRTVLLADVRRGEGGRGAFALRRVGVGLCMPDRRGRDTVVSTGRLGDLDVPAGAIERAVLLPAEALLGRGRLVVGSPTFAVYRGPATLRVGAQHREVELCYGLLVDPRDGTLRVALWAVDPPGGGAAGPDRLRELPGSYLWSCPLDVRAGRILGGVPVTWSFAMQGLPDGDPREIPPPLRPLFAAADPSPEDLRRLEAALGRLLSEPDPGPPPAGPARAGAAGSGPGRSGRTSTAGSAPP